MKWKITIEMTISSFAQISLFRKVNEAVGLLQGEGTTDKLEVHVEEEEDDAVD